MLKNIRLFVLDMDGTIYIDDSLFPWTLPFLDTVRESGKRYVFLTNNSSKGPEDYEEKLKKLGIPNPTVFTSGEATASFILKKFGKVRVYIFGTDSLKKVFRKAGLNVVEDDPEVLILGYDTQVTYEKVKKFAVFLRRDLPYVATHPDINCPSKDGLIPDAGSFMALFETSTGRAPDFVVGKPNPQMLYTLVQKFGLKPHQVAVVGDRLYTDMKLAKNSGAVAVLVLSGETTKRDLERSDVKPDFVVENLGELTEMLHS